MKDEACGSEVWGFGSGVIGRVETVPFRSLPWRSSCMVREQKQVPYGNDRKKSKSRTLARRQSFHVIHAGDRAGAGKLQVS